VKKVWLEVRYCTFNELVGVDLAWCF